MLVTLVFFSVQVQRSQNGREKASGFAKEHPPSGSAEARRTRPPAPAHNHHAGSFFGNPLSAWHFFRESVPQRQFQVWLFLNTTRKPFIVVLLPAHDYIDFVDRNLHVPLRFFVFLLLLVGNVAQASNLQWRYGLRFGWRGRPRWRGVHVRGGVGQRPCGRSPEYEPCRQEPSGTPPPPSPPAAPAFYNSAIGWHNFPFFPVQPVT